MVQKKNVKKATAPKTVAVVEKVEEKACTCGCNCNCGSGSKGVVLGAIIIAASVLAAPHVAPKTAAPVIDVKVPAAAAPAPAPAAAPSGGGCGGGAAPSAAPRAQREADPAMVKEIMEDKTNTVLGNPKGTFVMIEFFDYNCGFCKRMNKLWPDTMKKSDNIRLILVDTPIFGERSEIISRYAYAANKQGKFAEYHHEIVAGAKTDEAGLIEIGKKLGLNTDKLTADANSDEIKNKIAKNKEYTRKLGMGGVPGFIIDGKIQSGAFSQEVLDAHIAKANSMKK
ncbi:MAG: DsbA family protein [Alphaproteobacteria bacterium]|nr:DsbA family protein [Alphaproteobacteria bacterium]